MGDRIRREKHKNNKKTGGSSSKKLKGSTKFPFVKKGKSSRTGQEQSTTQVQQQSPRESSELPIQRPETQQQSPRESLKLPIQRPETQQQSPRESSELPIQRPETQQPSRESLELPIQRPETQQPLKSRFSPNKDDTETILRNRTGLKPEQLDALKHNLEVHEPEQLEILRDLLPGMKKHQEALKRRQLTGGSAENLEQFKDISERGNSIENQPEPTSISKYLSDTEVDPGMENYQRTRLAALEQQEQEEEYHRARVNNANRQDVYFGLEELRQTGAGIRPEGDTKNPKEAYDRLNQKEEPNILRERQAALEIQHLEQGVAEQLIIPDPQGSSESKYLSNTEVNPGMENIILRERQVALEIQQLEKELKEESAASARQREEGIGGSSIENKKKPPLTSKWSSSGNSDESKSVTASEWYKKIAQIEEQNQVQQEPVTSIVSAYGSNADSEEERFQEMLYGSD